MIYTIVFLVCTPTGCMTKADNVLFNSEAICESYAEKSLESASRIVPDYVISYRCINWGTPT